MAPRGLPMPPFQFWRAPLPPPPRGPPPAHALAPVEMEIDPLVLPQTAVLATNQLGQQNPPAQNEPQNAVPMETEQPVAALPDVPLVDSAMRWLEDEEDPSFFFFFFLRGVRLHDVRLGHMQSEQLGTCMHTICQHGKIKHSHLYRPTPNMEAVLDQQGMHKLWSGALVKYSVRKFK